MNRFLSIQIDIKRPAKTVIRHASHEMFSRKKQRCGKETWRLDQKDVVEFMELEVSSEIENRIGIKDSRGKINERNIRLLCVVCRLDDVISERSPSTSL